MTQKKSKYDLLASLLMPLLREWGYDTVHRCLTELHARQRKASPPLSAHESKPVKAYRRPGAMEIVQRVEDGGARRREDLRALAARFDDKTFLPTASDIRNFLEMRGSDPGSIKHRQDAFRKVLDVLLNMADDELVLLQASGTHAGPTQLGPLSDAIKATSAAVRGIEGLPETVAADESVELKVKPSDDVSGKPDSGKS